MSNQKQTVPQNYENPRNDTIWRGDYLVENPDVFWNLATEVPVNVDELWAGPRGISRIGPSSEGYAGYMLPERLHRFVRKSDFSYLLPPSTSHGLAATLPRQLEAGAVIPDGKGNEKLIVVDFDDKSRQMTFEATWSKTDTHKRDLHYSWEIHAVEGETPDTSVLLTRMRIEGLSHPKMWEKVGPFADRFTMNLVREGITGVRIRPTRVKKILGKTAITS